MAINSKIEWTDHTWNPWHGCPDDGARSPACDHCYARDWARRFKLGDFDREITRVSDATFNAPLGKKYCSGDRVFVCSLSDFFHPAVPDDIRHEAYSVMCRRSDLIFILLTKRPERIAEMLPKAWLETPRKNLWLGVTVENQEQADQRIPELLKIPAAVRFVSCEPLLGPVDLTYVLFPTDCIENVLVCDVSPRLKRIGIEKLNGIDWVIAGGESGVFARPSHPEWFRGLRDQCAETDTPFFFKQWGNWRPLRPNREGKPGEFCLLSPDGEPSYSNDGVATMHLNGNDYAEAMVRTADKSFRRLGLTEHSAVPEVSTCVK